MEKSKVDDKVLSSDHISRGLASSSGESITNIQNHKETEVSTISSERVYFEQTSIRSAVNSEDGQPNGKRKDLDSSTVHHSKVFKTVSSSSKERGEVVQLSSVDSTDPIPSQFSEKIISEKRPLLTHSSESNVASHEQESSTVTKLVSVGTSLENPQHCKFDLNEGLEARGAIPVVAKVGVPMGSPKKPLQFGGELGLRRSETVGAFRPTSSNGSKFPKIGNGSYHIRGFDLNVAATMDSEQPSEQNYNDFVTSKAPTRFLLDLNSNSENEYTFHKPDTSSFDLNNNPKDNRNNLVHYSENQQRTSVAAVCHARTFSGRNNASKSIFDMRRPPSYWIDPSSMRGFGHVQPQPFLVATTPTAEQVQMVVPSGLYIEKINNLAPNNFYQHSVLPQLNNHHVIAPVPQLPGSVLAAYPAPPHLVENQRINPYAFGNMRPHFIPNVSVPLMENGNRGVVNPVLFEAREKTVEQAAFPATQVNTRQMASWI